MLKDRSNQISLGLLIIAVIVIGILLNKLSSISNTLPNIVSIIGSVFSIAGIMIAFIQIYKIATNTSIYESTFTKTLEEIKKNDLISLVTRANQQVTVIKTLFEKDNIEKTISNFNQLMIDLSLLQKYESLNAEKDTIGEYIKFCAEMEVALFIKEFQQQDIALKEKYSFLTQIQLFLASIETQVKTPNKN